MGNSLVSAAMRRRAKLSLTLLALAPFTAATLNSASAGKLERQKQYAHPSHALADLFVSNWKQQSGDTIGNNCTANWSPAATNDHRYMVPWFPENKAAYWVFGYDREELGHDIKLKFEGTFPYARYMSVHVYNGQTGHQAAGKNFLKDIEIEPLEGHENPFLSGVSRNVKNRSFEFRIEPSDLTSQEAAASPEPGAENLINIPKDIRYPLIILRVYRPDKGRSYDGGVGLPTILAYNAETGEEITQCPAPEMPVTDGLDPSKRPDTKLYHDAQIRFYAKHPELSGLFGNRHNYYGMTGLTKELGDVALLRFKAPTTPQTANGKGDFSAEDELRYWSICMGGDVFTNTSSCLWDDNAIVDKDGFVKIAVGPDTEEFRKTARKLGYNPVDWGYHLRHVIYHRHMLGEGDFNKTYKQVPHLDETKPLEPQQAQNFIGEYAATGFYCQLGDFYSKSCGFEKPTN